MRIIFYTLLSTRHCEANRIEANLSLDSAASSRGGSRSGLGEVSGHILLEVEVGQLVTLLELEKLEKLGIGVNLATVVLVLKLLVADVGIDLTSHLSAGKNATLGLTQESSKLVGDESGLDETGRSAVSVGLAALVGLIGSAKLTGVLALKLVHLRAKRTKESLGALKLGKNAAVKSSGNSAVNLGDGGRSLSAVNSGGRTETATGADSEAALGVLTALTALEAAAGAAAEAATGAGAEAEEEGADLTIGLIIHI